MKYRKLLKVLKTHSPHAASTMDQVRADFENFYIGFQKDTKAEVEETSLNENVPACWISHADIEPGNCLLFLHGGGFTIGSTKDHLGLCSRLSEATQTRVFSIDYRLAPEHRFPAALDDCLLAYTTLLEKHDPSQIIITGISAGGNLLLAMLLALQEKNIPGPAAAVAMSPAVDLHFEGESLQYNRPNDWILPERLVNLRENYLNREDLCDPLISPIFGDLSGFPPLLLQVGTHELLLDDVRCFAEKLNTQSGKMEYQEWEGMFHCWQIFASEVAEGRQAIDAIGEFTRKIWH